VRIGAPAARLVDAVAGCFEEPPPGAVRIDASLPFAKAQGVEVLTAELAETSVAYFVAETEGQLVGYAKLKRNSREEGITGASPIELCRLYNLQEFIGKGIGKALMLKCLEFAKDKAHDTIWLGVWENNNLAINFYRKFGFEKCGEHIFPVGDDPQTDWLMQRNLY